MKLAELLQNQEIIIQLVWDEHKIEFYSKVIEKDNPTTEQRISWRGLSLATVNRDNKTVYCLKAHCYNAESNLDDRRLHERVEIQVDGLLLDSERGDIDITIHDISDNGISFYVPRDYELKSQQLSISFTDTIDERIFNIQAVCEISRVNKEGERTLIGCRVLEENKIDTKVA